MKTENVYLMTMGMNSIEPSYHGLVEITDLGLLMGEYDGMPVEDYGMWYFSKVESDVPKHARKCSTNF